ncbi:PorP/SprF family type IX secretion system membrane protein [Maribellus maritimus]|uniref:PorP/SprF family type IX secretion system membrane protein n=1 Tax=Maribellus maritimus TaxID=2870838 RepID=UPI001EEB3DBB|nr:PorP/SprF family type IX secretion system membrane protein [Maribellus maritimus]MCG6191086.1 PorP/SprF family type IX secretion system membrane protein [Maribellus maritimus]
MKKYILLGLFLYFNLFLMAQLPVSHSLFHENAYAINPSAIFQDDYLNLNANVKQSYVGYEDAPLTQSISFNGAVSDKVGLGLFLLNGSQGAFTINDLKGSYAYRVKFAEKHFLNLGLSLGMSWYKMDINKIDVMDLDDPYIINSAYYNEKFFINEIGALYQYRSFQMGLSAPYFIQADYQHFYAYTSVDIGSKEEDGFKITPIVLCQYLPYGVNQLDITLKFRFKPVWFAATYSTEENILMGMGLNFKNFKLGYTYEMNNQYMDNIAHSNQEVMLTYRFKRKKKIVPAEMQNIELNNETEN